MEDGGGENGQVIMSGTELPRFPRVGESLGVQFGAAEHIFQGGVIKGAVSGGIEGVLRGVGRGFGQWGLGGGDPLRRGVLVGQEGPWAEQVGLRLSPDVTGHVVPIGSDGCPPGLLTH